MFKQLAVGLILVVGGLACSRAETLPGLPSVSFNWVRKAGQYSPLAAKNVRLEGGFWGPKMQIYRERTIPHSWNYMDYELRSLRKAAGEHPDGPLNNTWGEANLYKLLETVALSLGGHPDAELERKVDGIVELIGRAQRPNGYVHAFITNEGKPEWDPAFLDGSHDGYVLGHLIEAAIAYEANTGKRALLDIAMRAADEAWEHFLGPAGKPGFCGHAELELALVELARVTGRPRYRDLALAFVEWRGRGLVTPFSATPRAYFQDALPVRQQRNLDGHAVRATFFASGVAGLALALDDGDFRLAANRFWESTTWRRMAITGSTGPRAEHEAFGEDYELPNNGYYESCASCGLLDFAQRMFLLEGRGETVDVLERGLYNAVLHGISLDGTNSYYQNPLSDGNRERYNSWVCCPPNLSRTLFKVGGYACVAGAQEIFLNLYVAGKFEVPLTGGSMGLQVETQYPWDGRVSIHVTHSLPGRIALNLRWPDWCESATLRLNGEDFTSIKPNDRGYISLQRAWQTNDVVEFVMDMPVRRLVAHPLIRDCVGKVALQRGPVVYGFEGLDNGGMAAVVLGENPQFRVEDRPDLLGGVRVVTGQDAAGHPVTAIPFYALANRGKSVQEVWVSQPGASSGDAWWEGHLYRPASEKTTTKASVTPKPARQ